MWRERWRAASADSGGHIVAECVYPRKSNLCTTQTDKVIESITAAQKANGAATVRLKIIGNEMIKTVGKSESRMVPKLPIIFQRSRTYRSARSKVKSLEWLSVRLVVTSVTVPTHGCEYAVILLG